MNSLIQKINISLPDGITLFMKREDQIHPFISGNKYRKLKYNLDHLQNNHYDTLVTFGGAFSNHIAATAYACKEKGINCVGVIRGEELWKEVNHNPTLRFAQKWGMKFEFITREQYRDKENDEFKKRIQSKYGICYWLPEGGTNELAIKGCGEILNTSDAMYNYICTAVGTGGTVSGLINSALSHQRILGFPALKGDFLRSEVQSWILNDNQWDIIDDYHFGGYAKVTEELICFLNDFYTQTTIPLDPIYTGKMLFGVIDMIHKGYFEPRTKILTIHTGGLQGIEGMNQLLAKKNKTLIHYEDSLKNQ
ncbi:1-aminocyclopropane-1-carboxylate deaminase/D-cysteine desulfhydrase [Flavobacterium columnare]|uniref:1-aminocyclopropane-1-carboxylate deaminase/D-cysteine desulfhydrase n=1 Tax=Flavobacterium columnare TaxID=996 RepID=A0AAI8GBT4_9FLAO|nr:pyridoxal-phosphate dependent enzyme [Flavobacterium columnare]AMO21293.1 1-aminocyclopropane-1-carboxylate deaminase/D-cysteine desulfhydrase [Flavobacterium columnare]AUX19316.1 1-aminocyclopropane-1-carboxylate deaminase [Flavobacterium columnare]QOG58403.1 1-aminocyclopropane-1-carboxylate deaminase/D-cysteine desulfhydrase [Flavobacterium columnare]QOG61126.1 1-aminocyclopropane-1-carboxylate deaminase/D-cysteine desulfhydrase [Flavobacterium columnare]QOG63847.1 1-aminocyclopropane-1-